MKDEEFVLFRDFIRKKSGLHFDHSKLESLKVSLLERMQAQNLLNFADYYQFLRYHPEGEKELRSLFSLITVNETSFFRQPEQFEVLGKKIIPELIREKKKAQKLSLSIWCAGCSSGEEPYSIALLLREVIPENSLWNVQILGTDIDEEALEEARKTIYRKHSLRFTAPEIIKKYFDKEGKEFKLKNEIKEMVNFSYHSLIGDTYSPPSGGKWDIIFCRNVLIYFGHETVEHIFDRFYENLNDLGYLFLGYVEAIGHFSHFTVVHTGKTFYYKKEAGATGYAPERCIPGSTLLPVIPPTPRVTKEESLPRKEEEFQGYYEEALKLINQANFVLALEKVKKMLAENPLLPAGHYLLGIVLKNLSGMEEATEEFLRAIYLDEHFVMAHFNLAEIYVRMGRKKDALRKYNNVLSILEDGKIEDPIPFSGGFSKKALINLCERYVQRLNPNKEKEKIPGIAPG